MVQPSSLALRFTSLASAASTRNPGSERNPNIEARKVRFDTLSYSLGMERRLSAGFVLWLSGLVAHAFCTRTIPLRSPVRVPFTASATYS